MNMANPADYSTLNWVKSEIDETLRQARHALEAHVANPQDTTQMRFCVAHLHQVRGTLQMIELYGAALLAEEMELLARMLVDAEIKQKDDAYEVLMRAILQLPDYLERLQQGHLDNPMVILPLLNELRAVRAQPLLSESALFAPDLTVVPAPSGRAGKRPPQADMRALARKLRPAYQQALLAWYRGSAPENLNRLAGIAAELQQASRLDSVAQIWWVTGAFIEALADAGLDAGGPVKQLLGQSDREIKRLIDSGEEALAADLPKELIKNQLYYIGRTQSTGARVTEIRRAFRLEVLLPRDQEIDSARARLAGPNRELMRTVFAVLREDLAQVKDEIDIFVRAETRIPSELLPLEETLRKVADTLGMLGLGVPRQMILEQLSAIGAIARGTAAPGEAALMEIASALLQAESTLDEQYLEDTATPHDAAVADTGTAEAAQLTGSEYREMQNAVIREARADIARIKDNLMTFFAAPHQHELLAGVPSLLRQVSGGLSMLSLTRAVEVLQACHRYITHALIERRAAPNPQQLDALTEAISALEYYLEALGEGRAEREAIIEQAQASVQQLTYPLAAAMVEPEAAAPAPAAAAKPAAPVKSVRLEEIDDEIIEVFLEEAGEEIASITQQVQRWKEDNENQDALRTLRRSFHTLKGSGRLVGAAALGEFAWSFENLLNRVVDNTVSATPELIALVEEALKQLPALVEQFQGNTTPLTDIPALMERASALSQPGVSVAPPVGAQTEAAPETRAAAPAIDPVLLDIYSRETAAHLAALGEFIERCQIEPAECGVNDSLVRTLHTLHGSAAMAGVPDIAALCDVMEEYAKILRDDKALLDGEALDTLRAVCALIRDKLTALQDTGAVSPDSSALQAHISGLLGKAQEQRAARLAEAAAGTAPAAQTPVFAEHDSEMVAVFMEEAKEILDASDIVLQQWIKRPADRALLEELQRELHTLKGGARMADITEMGDLSHSLESLLTAMVEGLLTPSARITALVQQAQDRLLAMLDRLHAHQPLEPAHDLVAQIDGMLLPESAAPIPAPAAAEHKPVVAAPYEAPEEAEDQIDAQEDRRGGMRVQHEQIRIRADLLDHLVNYAGEVSIARSRVEQQINGFKFNLVEMERTVARLRDQLRRLEIETETQILFRHAESGRAHEAEFDPLELDRFTQMQQLSRSLMESVSDMASIQGLLQGLVRESEMLLVQQARVNTDLQEGLMRTRMVQFSVVLPRLRRILRQTGEELGKEVELRISGAESEIDRTLLDRMVSSLEHMLRNAVDHGIELPEVRRAAGKPAAGTINLRLGREGADIVIAISDDGRGLDLERVRAKAVERGLLTQHAKVSDTELMQFILEPGFSTAREITQISGRGVGMDVVSSEIKQLGGTLSIASEAGMGATFTVRLPFTLSVSQVLLVQVGDDVYAIPLTSVERILRITHEELEQLYASDERIYRLAGQEHPFLHLGTLLNASHPQFPGPGKKTPALLVRVGEQHVALQVEGLIGSREIVVKSVGAQISTVKGITGATIMGDGRVVLMLDIAAMLRTATAAAAPEAGAAKESGRKILTVMVVDDSITVRKVTTRLLERHNMEVLTAKDGVDALTLLQQHVPDVMLLDIEMPRMDGYELAMHMRSDERLRGVPIIMITSRTGEKHRERALAVGVNRYLGKPFQEVDLLDNIRDLAGGRMETLH
ncbi:MAG: Hpt domain-containing protein [Gammaproteobacteria bacterium]|nr:Hpt domain-containing protein [Gammaproteobacteria bacterium]